MTLFSARIALEALMKSGSLRQKYRTTFLIEPACALIKDTVCGSHYRQETPPARHETRAGAHLAESDTRRRRIARFSRLSTALAGQHLQRLKQECEMTGNMQALVCLLLFILSITMICATAAPGQQTLHHHASPQQEALP